MAIPPGWDQPVCSNQQYAPLKFVRNAKYQVPPRPIQSQTLGMGPEICVLRSLENSEDSRVKLLTWIRFLCKETTLAWSFKKKNLENPLCFWAAVKMLDEVKGLIPSGAALIQYLPGVRLKYASSLSPLGGIIPREGFAGLLLWDRVPAAHLQSWLCNLLPLPRIYSLFPCRCSLNNSSPTPPPPPSSSQILVSKMLLAGSRLRHSYMVSAQ